MNNTDPRFDDTRVIASSGNVFIDLGFDAAEAEILAIRVQLMMQLRKELQQQGINQEQAIQQLGVSQSHLLALLDANWKSFTIDKLLTLAARLGLHPQITF